MTNEISRDELIAFAKTKPADESYNFFDNNNCALAQFGKSKFPNKAVFGGDVYFTVYENNSDHFGADYYVPGVTDPVSDNLVLMPLGEVYQTWGELVHRLEALPPLTVVRVRALWWATIGAALLLLGAAFAIYLWRFTHAHSPHDINSFLIGAVFFAVCFIIVLLPPRFDPAIRLKEWIEKRKSK